MANLLGSILFWGVYFPGLAYLVYSIFLWVWTAQSPLPKGLVTGTDTQVCLKLLSLTTLPMFIMMIMIMLTRVFSKQISPIKDEESLFLRTLKQAYSNTLEQTLLFVVNLWGASFWGTLGAEMIITLVLVFLVGRVLFFIGYLVGVWIKFQPLRGFGFLLTIGNSGILLGYNIYMVLTVSKILNKK